MPTFSTLSLFLLAAFGLLVAPGPAVLYVITRSAEQGRRAGFTTVLGVELAGLVHTAAAAFGLSALLLTSALAFSIVKYLGAAYLIYLGLRTLLTAKKDSPTQVHIPRSTSQLFTQGFLVNLLNPKTALFFYAFLPQFVDPTRGAPIEQIFLFGGIFVLLACCTDSVYALLGSTVGKLLRTNVKLRRLQRYITGSIYIVLGITTAVIGSEKK
ncbi:LysE family translocator [Ktedonosporobacter rubrisoli]|uniref:LysE family translocator n=1 Tax=Ktedonosporobacter rubrisoli TaxID=2509675 RepID=A0A4P6JKR2_KTERU|nr:LysE family translocator [Ktedonosporobacter rubrisoli]QBD75246.1 LysE family translocator [Ktedonosporobacter rubrisoli]